jgi:hypothetical protein
MEFANLVAKKRSQVSTMPTKLPKIQLIQALKLAKNVADLTKLLRYCSYEDEAPSDIMAQIMLARLVMLSMVLRPKSKKDRSQMRSAADFIKAKVLTLRSTDKWRLAFILQSLSPTEHDDEAGVDDLMEEMVVSKCKSDIYTRVCFSEEKGRHVTALEDIKACTIISVEIQPLAMIVFDPREGEEVDVVCVECAATSVCPFPCPTCPDVLFCSHQCRRQALDSHHKYECPMRLYALLKTFSHGMDSTSVGRILPLRLATKTTWANLQALNIAVEASGRRAKHDGYANTYHQLSGLAKTTDDITTDNSGGTTFNQTLLNLLQAVDYGVTDEPQMLAFLNDWTRIIDANSFAMEVPICRRRRAAAGGITSLTNVGKRQIGTAVYGHSSYFNHSCDPNVAFVIGGKANVMVATRRVAAGEELCISYGPTFPYYSKDERLGHVIMLRPLAKIQNII